MNFHAVFLARRADKYSQLSTQKSSAINVKLLIFKPKTPLLTTFGSLIGSSNHFYSNINKFMKYNFSLVFFSISLCASVASATKGFLDDGDDEGSQRSSQQDTPGCTPKRAFDATQTPGAPRRPRPTIMPGVVVPRRLFHGEPATLPGSPDATPPLWEGIAARAAAAAALAPQAPAALPEDDLDAETARAEVQARAEREEQDYLAYEAALDEERARAEEEAREDARRALGEAAVRAMIQRNGYGQAPCGIEGQFDFFRF